VLERRLTIRSQEVLIIKLENILLLSKQAFHEDAKGKMFLLIGDHYITK
jgi:hypothetical protein